MAIRGATRMATPARPCYAAPMPPTPETLAPETLAPELLDRLRAYAALLHTWTQRINLVSTGDAAQIWERHVADSLRLVPLVPVGTARGIDLGSGAGLPGLVLAVATGVPFDLVEADRRKAAFLGEAARVTGAPVRVHAARIEVCGLAPAPLVTARALAPLPRLLALCAPLLAPGGTLLLPKGLRAEEELAAAHSEGWRFELRRHGPADSPVLCITDPVLAVHA